MNVEQQVMAAVKALLAPPLESMPWHAFELEQGDLHERGELAVRCKENIDSDVLTKVLRAEFLHDEQHVYITNIFMPRTMTGNRLGKQVIKAMYDACTKHGYTLMIVDMVDSFYRRMLERGAGRIDDDSVQILSSTNLLGPSHAPGTN